MKNLKYNAERNDCVNTPEYLAKAIVNHFKPRGKILEPCKGTGNFLKFLPKDTLWCEINEGRDFLEFDEKVDWIITNPPWSIARQFFKKSMEVSDNVVFLIRIVHIWTSCRLREMEERGFGIKEIAICDEPKEFPHVGFALGCIHLKRGYEGDIKFGRLNDGK
jgi:hypothetical protein